MALIRFGVTSSAAANSPALSCIGSMDSSRKILPGCMRALTGAIVGSWVGNGGSSSAALQHGGDSWQQNGNDPAEFSGGRLFSPAPVRPAVFRSSEGLAAQQVALVAVQDDLAALIVH